ncbi:MAG: hypothetical protein HYU41_05240 [Candidatus Rokubacteria bacterium]|nr:hypothetical protein [Candidatus Rokubacteria bacterium]
MQDVKVEELTGKALEAAAVWAEANQRVLNQLVEFGTGAAKESIRLYAEWQQNALKWFHVVETNAQAVTKSAERLQAAAEQTGRGIQKTFTETVDRMKDTYARG